MKIKMQKGYPDSNGVSHAKHADAVKAQTTINLDKVIESSGLAGTKDVKDFIAANHEVVSDYIAKHHPKKKAAPKKAAGK